MNLRRIFRCGLSLFVALFFTQCANIGSPSGGAVDKDPPVLVKSKPRQGELGVNVDKVQITFDENVVLKNLNDFFLVSPPMEKKPIVKAYGKEVTVGFEDSLQSNAVYTLYFGNAIVDNNEGNPYSDFSFSFSTGEVLDTMRLQGHVLDAKTLMPEKGMIVGIYNNYEDSVFTSSVPMRIAKTDQEGYFSVNNVRPGSYIVRAISESDNDFRFNQPGEKIAFLNAKFETSQETIVFMDSIFVDSIGKGKSHHLVFKELRERDSVLYYPDDILLLAFNEDRVFQTLKSKDRKSPERFDFDFSSAISILPKIKLLNDSLRDDWYILEVSEDSLRCMYWLKDTAMLAQDTIAVIFDYQKTDSLSQMVWQKDTIQMRYKREKKPMRQHRRDKDETPNKKKVEPLNLDITASSNVNYFDDIYITAHQPLVDIQAADFELYEMVNDSTKKHLEFKFYQDQERSRTYRIEYMWDQEKKYQLNVDSATIYDIYGKTNDSISYTFSIVPEDVFSAIFLNVKNLKSEAVVQLLNKDLKVIEEVKAMTPQEVAFYYLNPGDYYVSLFYDTNGNGVWDSGEYQDKRQPEEVRFFHKKIVAKAYYEIEEDWDVEALPLLEQRPKELNKTKK